MVEDDDVFKKFLLESYCLPLCVRLFFSFCLRSSSTNDDTLTERDSPRVSSGSESLGRVLKTLGLPLGHLGHFQSQGSSSRAPLA